MTRPQETVTITRRSRVLGFTQMGPFCDKLSAREILAVFNRPYKDIGHHSLLVDGLEVSGTVGSHVSDLMDLVVGRRDSLELPLEAKQ